MPSCKRGHTMVRPSPTCEELWIFGQFPLNKNISKDIQSFQIPTPKSFEKIRGFCNSVWVWNAFWHAGIAALHFILHHLLAMVPQLPTGLSFRFFGEACMAWSCIQKSEASPKLPKSNKISWNFLEGPNTAFWVCRFCMVLQFVPGGNHWVGNAERKPDLDTGPSVLEAGKQPAVVVTWDHLGSSHVKLQKMAGLSKTTKHVFFGKGQSGTHQRTQTWLCALIFHSIFDSSAHSNALKLDSSVHTGLGLGCQESSLSHAHTGTAHWSCLGLGLGWGKVEKHDWHDYDLKLENLRVQGRVTSACHWGSGGLFSGGAVPGESHRTW